MTRRAERRRRGLQHEATRIVTERNEIARRPAGDPQSEASWREVWAVELAARTGGQL